VQRQHLPLRRGQPPQGVHDSHRGRLRPLHDGRRQQPSLGAPTAPGPPVLVGDEVQRDPPHPRLGLLKARPASSRARERFLQRVLGVLPAPRRDRQRPEQPRVCSRVEAREALARLTAQSASHNH
jgi:hypothetical protein